MDINGEKLENVIAVLAADISGLETHKRQRSAVQNCEMNAVVDDTVLNLKRIRKSDLELLLLTEEKRRLLDWIVRLMHMLADTIARKSFVVDGFETLFHERQRIEDASTLAQLQMVDARIKCISDSCKPDKLRK